MIQVVAYHVAPNRETADRIARSCSTFHADNDYLTLLDILYRSAELSDAEMTGVLLTDAATDLTAVADHVRIVRSPLDAERVMFSRLLAQIDFLEHHALAGDVAFVDSDMIVNAPLQPLFAEDFDLALTYRDDAAMPINGGVILVKRGRTAAAVRLLKLVRDKYHANYFDQAHWWGDQHALIDVLGLDRFAGRSTDLLVVDGVRIRLLPCERYNYSPDNRPRAVARPLADKVILHFKGERKRLMPAYWQAHLAFRYQSSWRTLWQKHRTRWGLRFAA